MICVICMRMVEVPVLICKRHCVSIRFYYWTHSKKNVISGANDDQETSSDSLIGQAWALIRSNNKIASYFRDCQSPRPSELITTATMGCIAYAWFTSLLSPNFSNRSRQVSLGCLAVDVDGDVGNFFSGGDRVLCWSRYGFVPALSQHWPHTYQAMGTSPGRY